MDLNQLRGWIGRSETRAGSVTAAPVVAMAATLDQDPVQAVPGMHLPPLWHWLYFTPVTRQRDLGEDGHARLGGFLPPVPLPRRMFAGGRFEFRRPLKVGDDLTRTSTIVDVSGKEGRTGALVFVDVRHEYAGADGVALVEHHDIVYREAPRPDAPVPAPAAAPVDEAFSRAIVADPVLLFRYSALTFNGHRIHYDRSYVTTVEGYPGLIVHGPLIATLLAELVREFMPARRVAKFSFRAVRPTFDIHPFTVCGRPDGPGRVVLWGRDHEGWLTMEASAELE